MLVLKEQFLNIDMDDGVKKFVVQDGATHNIKIYTINDTKANNKQIQFGGQSSVPTTQLLGRQPDNVRITGRIGEYNKINSILSGIAPYRIAGTNNIYNLFMVGSILTVQSGSDLVPEMPLVDKDGNPSMWIVNTFTVRRNISKRTLLTFELNLLRWYKDLQTI